MPSSFCKRGYFFYLCYAYCCLHIRYFKVIAKMRIYVLMVIAKRKFTILPVKTMSAQIIYAGRAHAVPSPITERTDYFMQKRVVCIYCPTFTHSHMVGRIKARCSYIAYCACKFFFAVNNIFRTKRIAVIFNKPQVMFITKCFYCF